MDNDEPLDYELDSEASEEHLSPAFVPCSFVTGRAGTGKTYQTFQRLSADPSWAIPLATTGIAAVNLGATTLNSALKFFDTDSLRDAYLSGQLTRTLATLAKDYRNLAIDEASMLDAEQLDLIHQALGEVNQQPGTPAPMGIVLVGDFAQLPPVRARRAFEAACWPEFASHTTRLEKVWRQGAGPFLDALNAARGGEGEAAADLLTSAGCRWETMLDNEFAGTTLVSKNDAVSRYNAVALMRVPGKPFVVLSRRWGKQRGEWGQNRRTGEWGIPLQMELKLGSYVMLLANQSDGAGGFEFVNGDCGWVREWEPKSGWLTVELKRTGTEVRVGPLIRDVSQKMRPEGWLGNDRARQEGWVPAPHRGRNGEYISGQVEYMPVRLAYATTIHKSQGLSLDKVQIDIRDRFFGAFNMTYVALSRCRTLEGLRLVGQRERFVRQVNVDPKVRGWL